jgi:DNA-binding NarL/FixJ family response regulator
MNMTPDDQVLRVLYVTHPETGNDAAALAGLIAIEPRLDAKLVHGVSEALAEVRTDAACRALFIGAGVPHNETLALISSLRRDRTPIAIMVLVNDQDRQFLVPAITAGADDALVVRDGEFVGAEATLNRVRHSRHVPPSASAPRLRVLYAGVDGLAWSVLSEVRFIELGRAAAMRDGVIPLLMDTRGDDGDRCEVLVVDELPGKAHTFEVIKWVKSHMPALPVIVLTPPNGADIGGAALDLGADEVVNKTGAYCRRLVATLHRLFLLRLAPVTQPAAAPVPSADPDRAELRALEEARAQLEQSLAAANSRIAELQRQQADVSEAQGFDRAMRDLDRADLASVRQSLNDERERRVVLEETLRHTEDRAKAQVDTLEAEGRAARRRFEHQLEMAADRLNVIAHETQELQSRLASELAAQAAERDRLIEQGLFGYAVLTQDGRLVRCSQPFADMLGYASAEDAVRSCRDGAFTGLPDHSAIVEALRSDTLSGRVESTARRADGRPFRVLTSAGWLPQESDDAPLVERLVVDIADRSELEAQLRLSRRLEAAGRLAAEMSPEIEDALSAWSADGGADQARAIALVRQLLEFSRRQARPAGYLSLNDAIRRAEHLLRPIVGEAISLRFSLGEVESVAGSEDDIEQLILEVVVAAAATLPFGGTLDLQTAPTLIGTTNFVLGTQLTAIAAGYGALSLVTSSSLTRTISRCGGLVRTSVEAGRSNALHVILPC